MKYLPLALLLLGSALAHSVVQESTPAANSVVTAPAQIDLIFSEEITDDSGATVTLNGKPFATGTATLAANHSELTIAAPDGGFAPGNYVVSWHDKARDDGHAAKGSFKFAVKAN